MNTLATTIAKITPATAKITPAAPDPFLPTPKPAHAAPVSRAVAIGLPIANHSQRQRKKPDFVSKPTKYRPDPRFLSTDECRVCDMYVCLCNAVTEKHVAEAIANGARCMKDLRTRLGVTKTCGRCAQCASECLRSSVASLPNYNKQCNLAEAS